MLKLVLANIGRRFAEWASFTQVWDDPNLAQQIKREWGV